MRARKGSSGEDHRAVVDFLSDPASYPDGLRAVERIETHMSLVFIAGDLVYKMKKPIRLDFVDFTDLEARRRNCEREMALNQRLAPGVYLRVVPLVRRRDGRLALDGEGRPIEWLLVMRRLDQDRLMSRQLAEDRLGPADLEPLCDLLAAFYAETPRIDVAPDDLVQWWREQIGLIEHSLADPRFDLPTDRYDPAVQALRGFLEHETELIAARAAGDRIVDGHGDLRPEHVHLGPPLRLVDRLEFNDRLRWIDPFDEVEFLGVECARLGAGWVRAMLSEGLANRLGDRPVPALLRFYRCFRACLRARLSIEHLRDPEPRTPERWPRQTREYLDLAADALPP